MPRCILSGHRSRRFIEQEWFNESDDRKLSSDVLLKHGRRLFLHFIRTLVSSRFLEVSRISRVPFERLVCFFLHFPLMGERCPPYPVWARLNQSTLKNRGYVSPAVFFEIRRYTCPKLKTDRQRYHASSPITIPSHRPLVERRLRNNSDKLTTTSPSSYTFVHYSRYVEQALNRCLATS